MKLIIVLSIVVAGAMARPSDETPEFPKKFDPSVHSDFKKKTPVKEEPAASSYFNYVPTDDLEILVPPQVFEDLFYEDLLKNGFPAGFVHDTSVRDPSDILVAPVEDTYLSPEGIPFDGLKVPVESEAPKDEPKSYLSYINKYPGSNVPMLAPEPSSYAMLLSALVQLPLPLESEQPMESDLPSELNPPSVSNPEEEESSYLSYVKAENSTYTDYKNSSRMDVLQPPLALA